MYYIFVKMPKRAWSAYSTPGFAKKDEAVTQAGYIKRNNPDKQLRVSVCFVEPDLYEVQS